MVMSLTRTLTTALAILALGALTAGCAGLQKQNDPRFAIGSERPLIQTASYNPAEEPGEVDWQRCDGECRFQEARRICTTMPTVGFYRERVYAGFMQFRDRTAFRARVMQSCVEQEGAVQTTHYRAQSQQRGTPRCPKVGTTYNAKWGMCA